MMVFILAAVVGIFGWAFFRHQHVADRALMYFLMLVPVLVLIWAVCRTPAGPKRDAEIRRASQVADRSSAEVQFGPDKHEQ